MDIRCYCKYIWLIIENLIVICKKNKKQSKDYDIILWKKLNDMWT